MSKISWQLEYMYGLERFGIRLGLEVMDELMRALGRPHEKFRSVHVTGTNGKGSTAILTAAALQEAGYKVGFYNSPHLVRFNERIRINGVPISDDELSALIEEIQIVVAERQLLVTFFEFSTAVAFLYFARQGIDIAIVEVGMGGDMDATNVIHPLVAIITNIGLDHTHILGKTKQEIAMHKAGIIKTGSVAITADTDPKIVQYLQRVASEREAAFSRVQDLIQTRPLSASLTEQTFRTRGVYEAQFTTPLLGRHQRMNASTALAALYYLADRGFRVELAHMQRAFARTHWEGRLTVVSAEPLILIDGAHNEGGIRCLREFLDDIPNCHGKTIHPKVLVLGMKKDKDAAQMEKLIVPLFDEIIVTEGNYQPWPAEDLAKRIGARHPNVRAIPNIEQALAEATANLQEDDMVLITGSLYMIGDAFAALQVPVAEPAKTKVVAKD